MKDPEDKRKWIVDEEAAAVVQKVFSLCVDGLGPTQIRNWLREHKVLCPTAYWTSKGRKTTQKPPKDPYAWNTESVSAMLERLEYLGHAQRNTRRGRVGYRIAHTLTAESTQGTVHFVDLDHRLRVTEEARCLTTRQDEIGGRHLGERSGALEETGRADVYPDSDRPSWDLL